MGRKTQSFSYTGSEIERALQRLAEKVAQEGIPNITSPERAKSEVIRRAIMLYAMTRGVLNEDSE